VFLVMFAQLLGSHVPLAQRTKALKELSELVNTQRLEEVSLGVMKFPQSGT